MAFAAVSAPSSLGLSSSKTLGRLGTRNGTELRLRSRDARFGGGPRVFTEWATRRQRAEAPSKSGPRKCPSARKIAAMLTERRDRLSRQDAVTVAIIEKAAPSIAIARGLLD
jgi:hypothetical protein